MSNYQSDTRASRRRHEGALPLQATYAATETAKRAAAAAVSAKLRRLSEHVTDGDDGVTPSPSAVRTAAKERQTQSKPRMSGQLPAADVAHHISMRKRQQPACHLGQSDIIAPTVVGGGQPPVARDRPAVVTAGGSGDYTFHQSQTVAYEHRGLRIELMVGDIAAQSIDVIVNAATAALIAGGGLAAALAEAAGAEYRHECAEFVRRHGRIAITECGITGAGELSAYFVVHAVSMRASAAVSEKEMSDATLATYLNLFSAVRELDVSSVAVPAIGSGIFGIPLDVIAEAAITAVLLVAEEANQNPGELGLVRFVLSEAAHVLAFKQAFSEVGLSPIGQQGRVGDQGICRSRTGAPMREDAPTHTSSVAE